MVGKFGKSENSRNRKIRVIGELGKFEKLIISSGNGDTSDKVIFVTVTMLMKVSFCW